MKLSYLLSCLYWSLLTLTVCGQEPSATVDRSELLLVVGAAGQEDYGRDFGIWADRWQQAAEQGGAAVTVIGRSAAAGGASPCSPDPCCCPGEAAADWLLADL